MREDKCTALYGNTFHESFLITVEQTDWPNIYTFVVWSAYESQCYQIVAHDVLEYHFMRIGTGRLESIQNGIPLDNIYMTQESDFEYWSDRIGAFAKQGLDSGEPPVCLEFTSHLFANRKRQLLTRNRNTGLLVVCRCVNIHINNSYGGPRPHVFSIPADE